MSAPLYSEDLPYHNSNPQMQLQPPRDSMADSRRLSLQRCFKALDVHSIHELEPIMGTDAHYFAREDVTKYGKPCLRLHMSGTRNSRRFVHVFLWWMLLLGPSYPISDRLLHGCVWKSLRCMCGLGVMDTRGHRKSSRVCINPRHYKMEHSAPIKAVLLEDIQCLISERGQEWIVQNPLAVEFVGKLQSICEPMNDMELPQVAELIREHCE